MAFSGLMLTTNGKILYAKNDQGKMLNFTRVAVGEGILGTGESLVNRSALINEKMSMIIDAKQAVDGETATALLVTLKNEGLTVGFYFREIGIFAEDPDTKEELLCLYDNAGEDGEYIPNEQSAVVVAERLRLLIARDGTQNVTINNSGNPLYLVFEDINDDVVSTQRLWSSSRVHTEIGSAVAAHNTAAATHADIRQAAAAAQATADEAKSIAQGRSRAVTYASYAALVAAINAMTRTELRVGDNLYVQTSEVPDLWVSSVELASSAYKYTTDAALVTSLKTVGAVQMGYYKVAMLETAKVDLSGYVPIIRKVNGKALSADITLGAGDILTASGATVEAAMSNKVNVPQEIPGGSDLNECRTAGMHYVGYNGSSVLNTPTTTSAFSLFIEKNNAWGDGVKQTFTPFTSPEIYCRVYYNGTWSRWDLVATATPPQEYDLPLAEGIVGTDGYTKHFKSQDGVVGGAASIKGTTDVSTGRLLATLPAGYRPAGYINVPVYVAKVGVTAAIGVSPSGEIKFWCIAGGPIPAGTGISFVLPPYVAAS